MLVLVVNTGSSSVKLRLLDGSNTIVDTRDLDAAADSAPIAAIAEAVSGLRGVDAVGHRVVHGGEDFTRPVALDGGVVKRLRELSPLAPLHQPASLAGIEAAARALPGVPSVACFDTAFHTTLPPAAATYAVPEQWRRTYGLRRYGFHGISHAYASRRAAELLGADPGRLVSAHLGAGASLAAVRGGRCVDTTMGFTPTEGLVMATRSGSVDPGMLLWLLQHAKMDPADLAAGLEREGGLAALAGTADMRQVVRRAHQADERAELALAVYLHRLRAGIAAMAAALGGLDTLVFTGGVGEHQPAVRAGAAAGLDFLGVAVDGIANAGAASDADISTPAAAARTFVVTAREDLQIAEEVRDTIGA